MPRHRVFTIIADITDSTSERKLRDFLRSQRPRCDELFAALEMLHFGCFVVFDSEHLGGGRSKLVFECNIDGPIEPFLDRLAEFEILDEIYRYCVGYPPTKRPQDRRLFLDRRKRMPNLYHIGAPYLTAQTIRRDRTLREALDQRLDAEMRPRLASHLEKEVAGERESAPSDVVRPWFAWFVALAGSFVALWLSIRTWPLPLPRALIYVLTAVYTLLALMSIVAGFKIWFDSAPDLRDLVRPWIRWIAFGLAWAALVRTLWDRGDLWPAVILAAIFLAATAYGLYTAAVARRNERLQALEANAGDPSTVAVWDALAALAGGEDDRVPWWEVVWNAKGWFVAVAVAYLIMKVSAVTTLRLVIVIIMLFVLKSMWLAILLGWPAPTNVEQDRRRIRSFLIAIPAGAAVLFAILNMVGLWPIALAIVLLGTLFSLWVVPLPSPRIRVEPLPARKLHEIVQDEDHGVQNHMAALIVLRDDHAYREWVLRSFLWVLNHLFYRSWLPDLYRGKLFGIPTVHYAQWIVLDRRNYLFLSNYDNSWTSYLDDFGQELEAGIQKIWGQGAGNPGTKDLGRFKNFARKSMTPHALWCRAYPDLALRQVWNNRRIRRALVRARDEEAMAAALRRLAMAPKTLPDLLHAPDN